MIIFFLKKTATQIKPNYVGLIMSYSIHKLNWLLEASGDIDINTTVSIVWSISN